MNDVSRTQQHPLVMFKSNLNALQERKELALPSNVSPEAFKNAAIVAVQDNPAILQCEEASVMKAIRTIAAAGLVPDGREAAIVPFKGKAQAMPMVFGLIKSARRSGDVTDIRAHIVYQNELDQGMFEYVVGDEETLVHRPILFGEKGEAVATYAIAKLKDGTIVREFMDKEQIEKVRKSSPQQRGKANPSGIWQDWTDEMWKKSVIRRLCKRLDLSAEDIRRLNTEQDTQSIKDVTPDHEPPRMNLAQRLAAEAEAEKKPDPEPAEDQDAGETIDGEVIPDEPAQPDEGASAGGSFEFDEGMMARKNGARLRDCPYDGTNGSDEAEQMGAWINGYNHQKEVEGQTP
jgi:recombination protein RecT